MNGRKIFNLIVLTGLFLLILPAIPAFLARAAPEPGPVTVETESLLSPKNPKSKTQNPKSSNLPPNVSANWWTAVQEQLRRKMNLLDTSPGWTATGEKNEDRFGYTVAPAGDVNGDGFSDVIVGAYYYDNGAITTTGKVYVYHGSAIGLDTTPAFSATGQNIGDYFGHSAATAGDVNGDGFSDVIIGAYGYDNGGITDTGKVYVYHGSSSGLSTTPAFTATGENSVNNFGYAAGTAGDVNGDGFSDIIVGASAYDDGAITRTGKVYVYHGSAGGLISTPAFSATGENSKDYFGRSVATAGDVNGDGYADVIIGAGEYPGGDDRGKVYVYHGSSSGLKTTPAFSATGENTGDLFGQSVSTGGDVNGDGYADVIVGASSYTNDTGKVYVYQGGPDGLNTLPLSTVTGQTSWIAFGYSVAGAGDVNGDGYADVIVGAATFDAGVGDEGRVYVYHGSDSGLSSSPIFTATGENSSDRLGALVAAAGDVNGDGFADVIVGAWSYPNDNRQGKAYVYHGSGDGLNSNTAWSAAGQSSQDYLVAAATAGDVNGDGFSDVIVGAYGYPSYNRQGKVDVYHGSTTGLSGPDDWTKLGENNGDQFGQYVATAGDVNGDGFADVIIGAPGYGGGSIGRAYVYHGSTTGLGATPIWIATGETTGNYFGLVSPAGDVNGDGYADVIVGAGGYSNSKGKVYVYHGSASGLTTTPVFTATGESDGDTFGRYIASAGDVNGDGFADVIIGTDDDDNGSKPGQVYVYHGSAAGLSATGVWTATGETNGDRFGHALATAGDVNGDGFSDIIIGASQYSSARGKIYVYYGHAGGLSASPDFTLVGETAAIGFGVAVGTAGDVNNDGYADIIVGLDGYNGGTGRVYAYHGGSSGLSATPTFTATGENSNDNFGTSAATAGDINGDGFADVIIAARDYPGNGYKGKVYLYHGSAGGGRLVLARQERGDGSNTPVQPWGLSHNVDSFQVRMAATDPLGRKRVKLQIEACPPGKSFGHANCLTYTGATWTDVTTASTGITLTETITGLASNTLYRWRARVLYAPYSVTQPGVTPSSNPAHGPWRRFQGQALEADLHVATASPTCFAQLVSTMDTFSSTTAQAVRDAVDNAGADDTIKVAGYCPGVEMRAGVSQTVYISQSLTIRGGYTAANWSDSDPLNNPTTLDAQQGGRVMYITGSGVDVTLEGLQLTGGYITDGGGGIYHDGNNLTLLTDTVVISNTAAGNSYGGGVYISSGNMTLNGGQIISNSAYFGGGVYVPTVSGSATLNGGQISNNSASYGGGVYLHQGSATLNGGQISSNSVSFNGGGVYVNSSNAAFSQTGAGTIAQNTAKFGGGVYIFFGRATLSGGQIISNSATDSGGGAYVNAGSATFIQTGDASLISGNSSIRGGGVYIDSGNATLSGGQIISNSATDYGGGVYVNQSTAAFTQTGDSTITGNFADNDGGGVYVYSGKAMLNGGQIISNSAGNDGGGVHVYYGSATLNGGQIISNSANAGGGVYVVQNSATFVQTGDTSLISGNSATATGGGVYVSSGQAMLNGGQISNNTTTNSFWGQGGGVYVRFGRATLNGGQIISNSAVTNGGGVFVSQGSAAFTQTGTASIIRDNTAASRGGGVYVDVGQATLNGGQIVNNSASSDGGGVFVYFGSATLSGGQIISNSADAGGGVYVQYTMAAFTQTGVSTIAQNSAIYGGGVYVNFGQATLNGGQIISNSASSWGGGVFVATSSGSFTQIGNTSIIRNNSAVKGGGVYVSGGIATLNGGQISNNSADYGGGFYNTNNVSGGVLTLTNVTVSSNTATTSGGGFYIGSYSTSTQLQNSTISHNTAGSEGGGFYIQGSILSLTNTTVSSNTASSGGGIHHAGGTTTLKNTIIANSVAGGDCSGAITSNGHNLSSDTTCATLTATGDITNTDPRLGPLQDNGGDTLTHALLNGSPAINAGDNDACPATDQRGVLRPQDTTCDIGAFEFEGSRPDNQVYLPIILKPGPTVLSVYNNNTGGNLTFVVRNLTTKAEITRCYVPNNQTLPCDHNGDGSHIFPAGAYEVQAYTACGGANPNPIAEKTYGSGPQIQEVACLR